MPDTDRDALLKAATMRETQAPTTFLDYHREQVLQLIAEEGLSRAAELLSIAPGTVQSWAVRRGLTLDTPRSRGEPRRLKRPFASPSKQLSPNSDYHRGRAEAYRHALELLIRLFREPPPPPPP